MQQHPLRLTPFTVLAGKQILQDKFYQVRDERAARPRREGFWEAMGSAAWQPGSLAAGQPGSQAAWQDAAAWPQHFAVRAKVGLKDTREFGSCSGNRWMDFVHLLINVSGETGGVRADMNRLYTAC